MGIIKASDGFTCEAAEFGGLEIYLSEKGSMIQKQHIQLDLECAIATSTKGLTLQEWQAYLNPKEVLSVPGLAAIFMYLRANSQSEDDLVREEAKYLKERIRRMLGISGAQNQQYRIPLGTEIHPKDSKIIHRPFTLNSYGCDFTTELRYIRFRSLLYYLSKHGERIGSLENLFGQPYSNFEKLIDAFTSILGEDVALMTPQHGSLRVVQIGVVIYTSQDPHLYHPRKNYVFLDGSIGHDMTTRRAIAVKVTDCR